MITEANNTCYSLITWKFSPKRRPHCTLDIELPWKVTEIKTCFPFGVKSVLRWWFCGSGGWRKLIPASPFYFTWVSVIWGHYRSHDPLKSAGEGELASCHEQQHQRRVEGFTLCFVQNGFPGLRFVLTKTVSPVGTRRHGFLPHQPPLLCDTTVANRRINMSTNKTRGIRKEEAYIIL